MPYNWSMYILHGAAGIIRKVINDGPFTDDFKSNLELVVEELEKCLEDAPKERTNVSSECIH